MRTIELGSVLLLCSASAFGANPVGLNVQAYPAGLITEVEFVVPIDDNQALLFRAGYNFTDRRDFGEHDNEEGGGPGLTLGYRYATRDLAEGWFFGARADLWFMKIDWKDPGRSGTTDVVVLQPTAEVGYTFPLSATWSVQPFLALGAEINVDTDGEDVGDGAIFLVGVSLIAGSY